MTTRTLTSGNLKPHLQHTRYGYWRVANINLESRYPERDKAFDFAHMKNTALFNTRLGILKLDAVFELSTTYPHYRTASHHAAP